MLRNKISNGGLNLFILALLLFLSRLTLIWLLGSLTHGQEFTDDAEIVYGLVRDPWQFFQGRIDIRAGSYAPLLGPMLSIPLRILQSFFPDFYAIRILYAGLEAIAAGFILAAIRDRRILVFVFLLLQPMGWMTSTIMAQDEIVAVFFLSAVLWLVSERIYSWASLIAGLGIVCSKIFLLIPFGALILFLFQKKMKSKIWYGFAPVLTIYSIVYWQSISQGSVLPFLDFAPEARYGIGLWTFLQFRLGVAWPIEVIKNTSVLLAMSAIILMAAYIIGRKINFTVAHLTFFFLLCFFTLFYQCNPEYLALLLPPAYFIYREKKELFISIILSTFPWATNFFYGLHWALIDNDKPAKMIFVEIYRKITDLDPDHLYAVCLVVNIVALFLLSWFSLRSFLRERST